MPPWHMTQRPRNIGRTWALKLTPELAAGGSGVDVGGGGGIGVGLGGAEVGVGRGSGVGTAVGIGVEVGTGDGVAVGTAVAVGQGSVGMLVGVGVEAGATAGASVAAGLGMGVGVAIDIGVGDGSITSAGPTASFVSAAVEPADAESDAISPAPPPDSHAVRTINAAASKTPPFSTVGIIINSSLRSRNAASTDRN